MIYPQPPGQRPGFGLFPFRSPLLRKSMFLSLPPGSQMFQFSGCHSTELCIHSAMTGHYSSRVPPFGYLRINSRSQIPVAFRSLLRPSSLPDAKASAVRPYYLDPYFFPSVVKEHCKLATKSAVISFWLSGISNQLQLPKTNYYLWWR